MNELEKNKIELNCPNCGRKFVVTNPTNYTSIYNLPIIDCKCGRMLEYCHDSQDLKLV